MITVGGVEQARIGAGQSVEIGRKPIRPLRDDGFKRIDIVDNKRSMSKRHALLIVSKNGVATIRDLHSTNGTYLVGDNGNLMRLEPDIDFQLPNSIMRMQFGDVPIDFVHVEEDANEDDSVRDLFSYATDDTRQEPDASDLSVDQILDLRAGEPTGVFHAQSVSQPDLTWNREDSVLSSENINVPDANAVEVEIPVLRKEEEVEPRNLFDDAQESSAAEQSAAEQSDASSGSSVNESENSVSDKDSADSEGNSKENLQDDSLSDSLSDNLSSDSLSNSQENQQENPTENTQLYNQISEENNAQNVQNQDIFESVESEDSQNDSVTSDNAKFENNELSTSESESNYDSFANSNVGSSYDSASSQSSQFANNDFYDEYTPAFEPGSVFEKVSQGEFDSNHEVIEAGGFTSDEAKQTSDFSEQFEMAKYSELLPYLAMNTNLYDDLYAWLAAQSNADVDEALARNSGYDSYRKAMGSE